VAYFVDQTLGMGSVAAVYIQNNKSSNGADFRSAIVHIDTLTSHGLDVLSISAGQNGYNFTSNDYHFANGKPMTHLKITIDRNMMAKRPPYSDVLQLVESDWRSIYIPVVPNDLAIDGAEVDLTYMFEDQLKVGRISRIDYVTRILPDSEKEVRSAYIHFEYWCDNLDVGRIRKFMNEAGEFHCRGYYNGFDFLRFDNNRFLALKINHKPIPEADGSLNIHQLNAIKIALEQENSDLRAELEALHEQNVLMADQLQGNTVFVNKIDM